MKYDINTCPKCGGILVERKSEYGKFIGCNNYLKM
ncbi:MAG: topoisomerase DNA-binding C4 zinc finger domain-containing protein [Bacilli bacterium]|nr:topoisomerase DNA-binding C4 zinc finger domain-containing protein [Bacilli bacterium]